MRMNDRKRSTEGLCYGRRIRLYLLYIRTGQIDAQFTTIASIENDFSFSFLAIMRAGFLCLYGECTLCPTGTFMGWFVRYCLPCPAGL